MEHAVSIVTTSATPTAVIRQATTWERYPTLWGDLLGEVWAFLRTTELQTGRNVMVYADDVPNVEVGVEVGEAFASGGRVVASALPAGRAATAVARGAPSPEGIHAAHRAVIDWVRGQRRGADRRPLGGLRPLARRTGDLRDRRLLAAGALRR
jgi:hypothetical protein